MVVQVGELIEQGRGEEGSIVVLRLWSFRDASALLHSKAARASRARPSPRHRTSSIQPFLHVQVEYMLAIQAHIGS